MSDLCMYAKSRSNTNTNIRQQHLLIGTVYHVISTYLQHVCMYLATTKIATFYRIIIILMRMVWIAENYK